MTATSAFPGWDAHPEVWLLVATVIAFGFYAARVIQPHAVAAGGAPITNAQRWWFVAGVASLWIASDWPLHDLAEERLYGMHMLQHMLLTVVVPPVMLLATPEWLGRFILGNGRVNRWFHRLARPLPAAIGYNIMAAASHWSGIVNLSVENGPFHYLMHVLIFGTALLLWVPVCGPFRELHMSPPGKMAYVFLMSVVPTIPAAFLTASDSVLYKAYDHGPRLWGISVLDDQQYAGVVMKVIEGAYLWAIIIAMMLHWLGAADRNRGSKFRGKLVVSAPPSAGSSSEVPGPSDPAGAAGR